MSDTARRRSAHTIRRENDYRGKQAARRVTRATDNRKRREARAMEGPVSRAFSGFIWVSIWYRAVASSLPAVALVIAVAAFLLIPIWLPLVAVYALFCTGRLIIEARRDRKAAHARTRPATDQPGATIAPPPPRAVNERTAAAAAAGEARTAALWAAAEGGTPPPPPPPQSRRTPSSPPPPTLDPVTPASPVPVADELTKLAKLHQDGYLSAEEFEAQKARLLQP